jgi:hypothetical protein
MKLLKLSLLIGTSFFAATFAQADRNKNTYYCPPSDGITIKPHTNKAAEWKIIGEGKEITAGSDIEEIVLFKGTYKPDDEDRPIFADPTALEPVSSNDLWNLHCESHLKGSPEKKFTIKISVNAAFCTKNSKMNNTFKCIPE